MLFGFKDMDKWEEPVITVQEPDEENAIDSAPETEQRTEPETDVEEAADEREEVEEAVEEPVVEDEKPEPAAEEGENVSEMLYDLSEILQAKIESVAYELKEKFANVIERQELTIQKQHQTTSRFQEDLIYKIQKPLIMEIIGIADNIRMMLQDQEREKNYDTLLEAVNSLEEWVEATLSNNSVRSYRETDHSTTELNRKRQEVIDIEMTDDPEKNNTYVCERPGYIWSMPYLIANSEIQLQRILQENSAPQSFEFVIRPEQVIKLKHKKEE